MAYVFLIVAIFLQIGLGAYILIQNPRARVNQLFAACAAVYAVASCIGLMRALAGDMALAADLLVWSTIIVDVWSGTFIGLSILGIFYRSVFDRRRGWLLLVPLALAALASVAILVYYVTMPDQSVILSPIAGTKVYEADRSVFAAHVWGYAYMAVWVAISAVLLIVAAVRRSGGERRSAVLLLVLLALPVAFGIVGTQFLPGMLKIVVPALSTALLFVAFALVLIRFRLFSTEEVALRTVISELRDGIVVLRDDRVILSCNERAAALLGLSRREIVHMHVEHVLAHSPLPGNTWEELWAILQQGQEGTNETRYSVGQAERIVRNEVMPVRDARGDVQGYAWILRDISDLWHSQEQIQTRNRELQTAIQELEQTSQVQAQLLETIRTLSAPAVPIVEGIIVLPITGQIDSERARRILNNLLGGINDHAAKMAIIDITGVPVVDTIVAEHLIEAARAALLMGCRPLLVGIRPEIAQVIVELGIDLAGLVTFSDLQSGVEYALRTLGLQLARVGSDAGQ